LQSHQRFREKHRLAFDLLSDPDNSVATAYGAYGEKTMYGRKVMGTIRSTFLIDETGRIEAVWSPVKVDGHVEQILAALKGETTAAPQTSAKKKTTKKKAAAKRTSLRKK
jgi:peroxiredoxin Q/BCP